MNTHNQSRRFFKNQQGSFTIEASLVFPIIFLVTILLIFLSLYVYQKSSLHYIADRTAKNAAWTWDNTYKDGLSGAYDPYEKDAGTQQQKQNDGLYWRFSDFNLLDVLTFQFSQAGEPKELIVTGTDRSQPARGGDLVTYKLKRAVSTLPPGVTGSIQYKNDFYKRTVTVRLENPLRMPDFIKVLFRQDSIEAEASSYITEPTEFIRSVDFALYAGKKMVTTSKTTIMTILKKKK